MPSILKSKKIIRVGIDGGDFQPFRKVNSGIKRIVDSFLKEISIMKNNNFIFNYYYFGKSEFKKKIENINFIRLPKKFFASVFLPLQFIKDRNNVFLGFSGYLPSLINLINTKKVIFLYDLGFLKFPKFYDKPKKLLNDTLHVIRNANKIVILTEYAKKELKDKTKLVNDKKLISIYPGFDHFQKPLGAASINRIIEARLKKYFLFVGVIKPVKNIQALFRYFLNFLKHSADKNYQLIIIGQKEEKYFDDLLKDQYYLQLKENIIFKENTFDQELVKYYLQSTALLNFSHEEGFCFPVLEALSLGKKVIVNNLPIYHEFENKFGNLLVGKNEKEIVQLMVNVAKNMNYQLLSARLSIKNILTWRNFVITLLKTIKTV